MNALIKSIKQHFEVNRHEALSIIFGVLGFIIIATALLLSDSWYDQSEAKLILTKYDNLEPSLSKIFSKRKKIKEATNTINHQHFNPNTVTFDVLVKNGVSKYAAKNLINFRNKGKVYKAKEDLLKVYGISEETYLKIEPYIDLPSQEEDKTYATFERIYDDTTASKPIFKAYTPPIIQSFDLNLATQEDLRQIRGIGEVFANRIIKYRDGLGGFHDLKQVKSTYGLADSTYQELLKSTFLKEPPKKIKINTIEEKEWKSTLLKNYQKRAIIAYRKQHGPFEQAEDLMKIKVLTPDLIERLIPYLDFSKPI